MNLYYQWKEIQETDESIQKDQERVSRLRTNLEYELAKINQDKDHPNFLGNDDVIKYGSDKNNQFNYIMSSLLVFKNK